MSSTYSSNLKIELMGTGDQSGAWGTTLNTNMGTALEEAIVGRGTANFASDADLTLTLTNSNATQVARAFVLNVTSGVSLTATRNLIVPTINKPYIIQNNTAGAQSIVVKTSAGTGITVPAGREALVYADGTNVVAAFDYSPTLTLGTALAVASGGTGSATAAGARTNLGATTVGGNLFTITDPSAVTFLRVNADNTTSLLSAADFRSAIGAGTGGGDASTNTAVSVDGEVTLFSGTSGKTLKRATGSGIATLSSGVLGTAVSGTDLKTVGGVSIIGSGNITVGSGDVVAASANAFTGANTFYNTTGQTFGTGTSTQDGVVIQGRAGGTVSRRVTILPGALTASRTLTLPDNTGTVLTTGATVTVAQGGTGATTLTGYLKGNGTSAFTAVSTVAGSDVSGNISGNAANVTGTVAVGNGGTGATTFTSGGLLVGNGAAAVGIATAAQIVAAISTTAVAKATSATNADNATNIGISADTTTATAVYPVFVGATSGNNAAKVNNARLSFVPSTGVLTSTKFASGSATWYDSGTYAVSDATLGFVAAVGGVGKFTVDSTSARPNADNTTTCGTAAQRWSTVYAGTGTINTSDAREKSAVQPFGVAEIEAAKQLSREIGTYKWLSSIAQKGDSARTHIGLTVQRAIEVMQGHGLDPFAYGFICYDEWSDGFYDHAAKDGADAILDEDGNIVVPAVDPTPAWREQVQWAGNRYSFRYDELTLFIARGIEARLSALET